MKLEETLRRLSGISVERRSILLLIIAALLFSLAMGLLFFQISTRHFVIVAIVLFLTASALSVLMLAGLLEQRRRYVSRIRNVDRAHKVQLSTHRDELSALASQIERIGSQGERFEQLYSAQNARLAEMEIRSLRRTSLLTDAIHTPHNLFTAGESLVLATALIEDDPLRSFELLSVLGSFDALPLSPRRRLAIQLRSMGYLNKSLRVLESVAESTQSDRDRHALRNRRSELEILQGKYKPKLQAATGVVRVIPGHVLHVVGKSLPLTQSGYTLRTHYSARAQVNTGLTVSVVSQMGEAADPDSPSVYVIDGISYHSLPGEGRTARTIEEWLDGNIEGVAAVVKQERPAVLHAHSDFFNALTAQIVGEHYGIPVIYESRGFWEESWLSRVSQKHGVKDWDSLAQRWGMPDAYVLRSDREREAREKSKHVFTLARVMQSHIESQGLPSSRISLVPNAVSVDDFPVLGKNEGLMRRERIPSRALVIGYISSIVEYEGIDTLLEAFYSVRKESVLDLRLLIVGDGPFLANIKEQNSRLGATDVIFTGRVSHDEVLQYYSLIDVFVVPRRPSRVCHLVTPLKPFEAFSTGRAVIMSDVEALKEIAEDSGAARLFTAGDANSLAEVLRDLIDDPEMREELSAKGAAWVRDVRTWDANAEVYREVYRSLGIMSTPDSPSLPEISEECFRETVEWLSAKAPINYVDWFDRLTKFEPRNVIEDGWTYADFPPVPLNSPVNWSGLCGSNRTWAFKLHTWEFMDPLVRDYLATGNLESLNWCIERALSWLKNYVWMDARTTESDDMAWYDMALGLRSPRLLALIDFVVRENFGDDVIKVMLEGGLRHAHEHAKESSFNPRTNHGYYAAVGQIVLASGLRPLPGMTELEDQGQERLSRMAATQFLEDGIHSEHSPDYHRMLLDSFQIAIANGLIKSRRTIELIEKAGYALGWMIKPDGGLVQFGDSPERIMTEGRISEWNNPHTQFLRSVGQRGKPDDSTFAVFSSGGYAFVRDPQPRSTDDHKNASYLAVAAAFHSRAHKHADDLNLVWSDHGKEILVDGGRFGYGQLLPADSPLRMEGYYYGSIERQYVESTVAHNTVEADGRNHDRRNRRPYGSALGDCYESRGTYVINGSVEHGSWAHTREIQFVPGTWLIIQDDLISLDDGPHDFRAWFNLAGDLDVDKQSGCIRVTSPDWNVPLWITSTAEDFDADPVRGQRDPLRGWRSLQDRSLIETWSLAYGLSGSLGGTITTVFSFGQEPLTSDPR